MLEKIKKLKTRLHDLYYSINDESEESEESDDDILPASSDHKKDSQPPASTISGHGFESMGSLENSTSGKRLTKAASKRLTKQETTVAERRDIALKRKQTRAGKHLSIVEIADACDHEHPEEEPKR